MCEPPHRLPAGTIIDRSPQQGVEVSDRLPQELETPMDRDDHSSKPSTAQNHCRCFSCCGRIAQWANVLAPEVVFLVFYAVVAIVVTAILPSAHVFFRAVAGLTTPFGLIFGVCTPLLVFHVLRLALILLAWGVCALWRVIRNPRECHFRPRFPMWAQGGGSVVRPSHTCPPLGNAALPPVQCMRDDTESATSSTAASTPDETASMTPSHKAVHTPWRRPSQLRHRTEPATPLSCATKLAACDVCLGLFLYILLGLTATVSWSGCAKPPIEDTASAPNNTMLAREIHFPSTFKYGAATAAYQVEGGLVNSSWHAFEYQLPPYDHTQGRVTTANFSGKAADMWNLFDEDLERMKSLNLEAYRMSVSWSRLHLARGEFDMSALARYRQWLRKLRVAGIEPMVTLLHYEEPIWVAFQGSWANASTADDWLEFVTFIAQELGDYVDVWVTQNEPFVYAGLGWLQGRWPPGFSFSLQDWWRVMLHLSDAHRRAYVALHEHDSIDANGDGVAAAVGIAKNLNYATPARLWSVIDPFMAGIGVWGSVNRLYLELIGGEKTLDFLGINHYFHLIVRDFGQEYTVPETSLYQITCEASGWYPGLPIAITEHGYWTPEFPGVQDTERQRYILGSLRHLMHATGDGVKIIAYQYWAFIDSFEWDGGFRPRYGLYAVDFIDDTRPRIKRDFAEIYGHLAARHAREAAQAT